jgi:hypothetical protein
MSFIYLMLVLVQYTKRVIFLWKAGACERHSFTLEIAAINHRVTELRPWGVGPAGNAPNNMAKNNTPPLHIRVAARCLVDVVAKSLRAEFGLLY